MSNEEFRKLIDTENSKKRKCKCGNIVKITNQFGRLLCSNCGHYVFLNKRDEFEYRIKERLRK